MIARAIKISFECRRGLRLNARWIDFKTLDRFDDFGLNQFYPSIAILADFLMALIKAAAAVGPKSSEFLPVTKCRRWQFKGQSRPASFFCFYVQQQQPMVTGCDTEVVHEQLNFLDSRFPAHFFGLEVKNSPDSSDGMIFLF